MSAIMQVWGAMRGIVNSSGEVTLVMMGIIALVAGVLMRRANLIVSTTFVALIAFAAAIYLYAVAHGANAASSAQADWHNFLDLHMLTLVAYAATFAIAIMVVHLIRSLVVR